MLLLFAGEPHEFDRPAAQGAARPADGGDDGGVLPGLLAAVRGRRPALHLRAPGLPEPRGEHHAIAVSQVLHRHQSFHLRFHEQTGGCLAVDV